MNIKKNLELTDNSCEHCRRTFARPNTLLKHLCEQKRRWQDSDKPANRIAFNAWVRFYLTCQPSRKNLDYKSFISNNYYTAFIKFGSYCVDIKVINVSSYTEYLLKNNVRIDDWISDKVYTRYLIEFLRTESCFDAIKRSITTMLDIGESENIQLKDFFTYISSNKICHSIISGKISPWLLYNCSAGIKFLEKINEHQRAIIFDYIDPEKWSIKFLRDQESVKQARDLLKDIELINN